jgi:predicted HicB family RNase H-like nuclease
MKKTAYDFSKGERGKFFRPGAELRLPIYLDADVQAYLTERAAQKGMSLNEMVNGLLKQEIQIVKSVK